MPTTKSLRISDISAIVERETKINTPGSLNILGEIINREKININTTEILMTLPAYIQHMEENQATVFRGYYLKQMSIYQIRYDFEFKDLNDVENLKESSTNLYIEMLKKDYGIKG